MSVIARSTLALSLSLAGLPTAIQAQDDPREGAAGAASAPIIVFEFTATDMAQADAVAALLDMARAHRLARLEVPDPFAEAGTIDGTLVFEGIEAFSRWRETEMEGFFAPIGGVGALDSTLRVMRSDLMALSAPQGAGGALGGVSVSYRNSGNDAAGDADIDAVTVICPGEGADCKPSN